MVVDIENLEVGEVYEVEHLGEVMVKKLDLEEGSFVLDIFDEEKKKKYGQVDGYVPFAIEGFSSNFVKAV